MSWKRKSVQLKVEQCRAKAKFSTNHLVTLTTTNVKARFNCKNIFCFFTSLCYLQQTHATKAPTQTTHIVSLLTFPKCSCCAACQFFFTYLRCLCCAACHSSVTFPECPCGATYHSFVRYVPTVP